MEAKTAEVSEKDVGPERETVTGRVERATAKTISVLSCVAGLLGGYFQYLNAYQEQVREQAKVDVAAATAEFVEISNAYAEAQTLQHRIYSDFLDSISDKADSGSRKMLTGTGRATFQHYTQARADLQQKSDVFARKAQIYIDWPSNPKHNAANTKAVDGDPLTEALLDSYRFECDAPANLPRYALPAPANGGGAASPPGKTDQDVCAAANAPRQTAIDAGTRICAVDGDGKVDHGKPSIAINWHSAKHHLIVMHYCFEVAHDQIATARIWASDNDVSDRRKNDFLTNADKYQTSLDAQAARLDTFMNLVMSELERIQVRYRPVGPLCHVPLIREAVGILSSRCTPLRTAEGE